jgi:hypothetical protein
MMLGTREVVFLGGLSSKKVKELHDIAYALALLEEGTKEALITLIKSNLKVHPELQQIKAQSLVGDQIWCAAISAVRDIL